MKVKFDSWSAEELFNAYLDFLRNRNSKEVHIKYLAEKYGFKKIMEGKIELNDSRLKSLPKEIQYTDSNHELELHPNWKIEFHLKLYVEYEEDHGNLAELSFDDSLKNEVHKQFKEFMPQETK